MLLPHSKKAVGSNPGVSWDLLVLNMHVLHMSALVLSGFSGFLPQSKTCMSGKMGTLN